MICDYSVRCFGIYIPKRAEAEHAIYSLYKELENIDLAIVCSGTGEINPSLDYGVDLPTIDTNATGWTFIVDTLYHIFEQQGHGHLVAITSAGGLRGEPMAPAYSATKAYQINYMEALRKKAFKAGGNITITDVRPGLVDTAMAKGEGLFTFCVIQKNARMTDKTNTISVCDKSDIWPILLIVSGSLFLHHALRYILNNS